MLARYLDGGEGARARLETIKLDCSPAAFDKVEEEDRKLLRYAYRLDEKPDDGSLPALYGFVIAPTEQYVQFAAYFNHAHLLADALDLWRNLHWIDNRH